MRARWDTAIARIEDGDGWASRLQALLQRVRGVAAIGGFASRLMQSRLSAVSGFFSPSRQCCAAPLPTSFHRILTELDPEVLDHAVRGFVDQSRGPHRAVAIEHGSGVVCGQVASGVVGEGIQGARRSLREIDIEGRSRCPAARSSERRKDFVFAHPSADEAALSTALIGR